MDTIRVGNRGRGARWLRPLVIGLGIGFVVLLEPARLRRLHLKEPDPPEGDGSGGTRVLHDSSRCVGNTSKFFLAEEGCSN